MNELPNPALPGAVVPGGRTGATRPDASVDTGRVAHMDLGLDKAKVQQYKAQVVKLLGHPAKMRVALLGAMTALAIGAVYMPLSDKITQQRRLITTEQRRLHCIQEVESLRKETQQYSARIDPNSDTNEWVKYLLDACRENRVRLRDMQSKEARRVGPYSAVVLTLEVNGPFAQLKQFLEWLEQSDRLLRVDSVRLEKLSDSVTLKVNVLGLVVKSA